MNRQQKLQKAAMKRYQHYCYSFIALAQQVNEIEQNPYLKIDLSETKDKMRALLEQMVVNKPSWA